jgi:hypothetical protein
MKAPRSNFGILVPVPPKRPFVPRYTMSQINFIRQRLYGALIPFADTSTERELVKTALRLDTYELKQLFRAVYKVLRK